MNDFFAKKLKKYHFAPHLYYIIDKIFHFSGHSITFYHSLPRSLLGYRTVLFQQPTLLRRNNSGLRAPATNEDKKKPDIEIGRL